MLYKPKNLCPSSKLQPVVYSNDEEHRYMHDFSFSMDLNNSLYFNSQSALEIRSGTNLVVNSEAEINYCPSTSIERVNKLKPGYDPDAYLNKSKPNSFAFYGGTSTHTDTLIPDDSDGKPLEGHYILYYCDYANGRGSSSIYVGGQKVGDIELWDGRLARSAQCHCTTWINNIVEEKTVFYNNNNSDGIGFATISKDQFTIDEVAKMLDISLLVDNNITSKFDYTKEKNQTFKFDNTESKSYDFIKNLDSAIQQEDEIIIPLFIDYSSADNTNCRARLACNIYIKHGENNQLFLNKIVYPQQCAILSTYCNGFIAWYDDGYTDTLTSATISGTLTATIIIKNKQSNNITQEIIQYGLNNVQSEKLPQLSLQKFLLPNIDLQNNDTFQELIKILDNDYLFEWRIKGFDSLSQETIYSNWETFISKPKSAEPVITIMINSLTFKDIICKGVFSTPNDPYKSFVSNYQWKLYSGTIEENKINGRLIYNGSKIYAPDLEFSYNNLLEGNYVLEVIIEDNYGQIWSKREPFSVNYEQNDLYLNLQSELDKENTGVKLKWDKLDYGVAKAYTCGNILDNYSYLESNKYSISDFNLIPAEETNSMYGYFALKINNLNFNLDKIKYIECLGNFKPRYTNGTGSYLTYKFLNTDLYLKVTSNWSRRQPNKGEDWWLLDVQYDINLQYNSKIISEFSSVGHVSWEGSRADLPSSLLEFSGLRNKIINMFTISAFQVDLDKQLLRLKINDNIVEIQNIDINNFKNLELNNCTRLDYLVASKESEFGDSFNYPLKNELGNWDSGKYDCLLTFSNEDNYLAYRDPSVTTNFTGYNMKRYNPLTQKVLDMGQYYFTLKNTKEERRFVDYSLPHNEEVKYLIYPQGNEIIADEESQELVFSPIYSDSIKGDWDKWCLFTTRGPTPKKLDGTADNGYNENVLLVDKVFFFEMNVETGAMKNNTDFSIVKNFTPYPHIQRSPSNYWSGQLKGLLGRLAIDDCTFKQTPTMLQEIKELTQNTSRKFLKDRDGNFWEVELSSDITIDNNDKLDVQLKTKSFNWVEVGDASDIALVSVGSSREDWLLTELGQEQIDISRYIWDNNAIWDDNDFWTESE